MFTAPLLCGCCWGVYPATVVGVLLGCLPRHCCGSAAGVFTPPLFVFPGKRMLNQPMGGAPAGAIGGVNYRGLGYTDPALYLMWIRHLVSMAGCTKDSPHILLMGGHESQKTLEVIDHTHCTTLHPSNSAANFSSCPERRTLGCATIGLSAIGSEQ